MNSEIERVASPNSESIQRIYRVIREFRLSNMRDEDGEGYPLVDLMSNPAPADISTGEEQMGELAFAIAEAMPLQSLLAQAQEALVYLEAEARRFAGFYPEASDGRNTFIIFADKVAALQPNAGEGR